MHKLTNTAGKKEEFSEQWKESVVTIYKRSDNIDCSNYRGASLLN
jgi:hypothetical protein